MKQYLTGLSGAKAGADRGKAGKGGHWYSKAKRRQGRAAENQGHRGFNGSDPGAAKPA